MGPGPYMTLPEKLACMKYSRLILPRYTSYPVMKHWSHAVSQDVALEELAQNLRQAGAYSLAVHLPIGPADSWQGPLGQDQPLQARENVWRYIEAFSKELRTLQALLRHSQLVQLRFLAETHASLDAGVWYAMARILETLPRHAAFQSSVEVLAQYISYEQLRAFKAMGVQHLTFIFDALEPHMPSPSEDPQKVEHLAYLMRQARSLEFASINFELNLEAGLPPENAVDSLMERLINLRPDRFSYRQKLLALLQEPGQADADDEPMRETFMAFKLTLMNLLIAAGYENVGLEYFVQRAVPEKKAQFLNYQQSVLQGLSSWSGLPLVGVGPAAMSAYGTLYKTNPESFDAWLNAIDHVDFPFRGHRLTSDEQVRRAVLEQIFSRHAIEAIDLEARFDIKFWDYFGDRLPALRQLEADGVLRIHSAGVTLSETLGFCLQKVVASVFDSALMGHLESAFSSGRFHSQAG